MEETGPKSQDPLKELEIWVDLIKFYYEFSLKGNLFFYSLSGVMLSFCFTQIERNFFQTLLFSLWVPAALGAVLGTLSIYGSRKFEFAKSRFEELRRQIQSSALPEVGPIKMYLLATGIVSLLIAILLLLSPWIIPCLLK